MSRALKILIDARFLGQNPHSGVEEYTRQMIFHLQRAAPDNQYQIIYRRFLGIPNKIFRWLPIQVDRLIKTDLIYSPHLNLLNHSRRVPRVLTIHDLSFIHFPEFFSFKDRLWHQLQKVKYQAQKAAVIVTDSQFSKNDISQTLKIPEEKITVIYPGINPELKKTENSNPHPLNPNPYILYLGQLSPRKNIEALIRAFNLLKSNFKNLKLVLAGAGRIKTSRPDIIFTGPVSPQQKLMLYNLAEVFVYPSFFEGFGFPPLEAQACGCPVVVANRASLPEIIGKSGLLVDPWRTEELSHAISAILKNKDLREKIVARGYQNVQKFSWPGAAEELLKIFSSFS